MMQEKKKIIVGTKWVIQLPILNNNLMPYVCCMLYAVCTSVLCARIICGAVSMGQIVPLWASYVC